MRAGTLVLDRILTLAVGLLLVAIATATWLWRYLPELTGSEIGVSAAQQPPTASWLPLTLGPVGLMLVLLGLRRLLAHLPIPPLKTLQLRRSNTLGPLAVMSRALTRAAADELADVNGVRSVRGQVVHERRQLVLSFVVIAEPAASLSHVSRACDQVAAVVARMAGHGELAFRVDLRVARRGHHFSQAQ